MGYHKNSEHLHKINTQETEEIRMSETKKIVAQPIYK